MKTYVIMGLITNMQSFMAISLTTLSLSLSLHYHYHYYYRTLAYTQLDSLLQTVITKAIPLG